MIVVYIERKITRKPMATAIAIMMLMNTRQAGEIRRGHQRKEILQGTDFVARQQLLDCVGSGCRVVGAVALDEENGGFVVRARHFLQRGHEDEQPGALAVLDDAGDVKIGRENMQASARL